MEQQSPVDSSFSKKSIPTAQIPNISALVSLWKKDRNPQNRYNTKDRNP